MKVDDAIRALQDFPWRNTGRTLLQRFREDRLGNTASSLTFTTLISLVPLFAVVLAVFSVFPMFGKLQVSLQQWLATNLIPDPIAKQVIGALTQFASKASRLGWVGFAVLLVTAVSLVLTIDRTFNAIWRVRRPRPLAQRVLIYWGVLTLGPLVLAGSVTVTSYAIAYSRGVPGSLTGTVRLLLDSLQVVLVTGGLAALYRYVPNTRVRWTHALVGGLFAATALELAKQLLGWYLKAVPTYSVLYGTFATLPILLVWFYVAWVIVLLGAVVTAYLPSLLTGVARRGDTPGWNFQLALELMERLLAVRDAAPRGLSLEALAQSLRVDPLQLEEPVGALVALDWLGRLNEEGERYVVLVDPDTTPMAPLAERLLLARQASTLRFWDQSRWADLTLAQARTPGVLPPGAPPVVNA